MGRQAQPGTAGVDLDAQAQAADLDPGLVAGPDDQRRPAGRTVSWLDGQAEGRRNPGQRPDRFSRERNVKRERAVRPGVQGQLRRTERLGVLQVTGQGQHQAGAAVLAGHRHQAERRPDAAERRDLEHHRERARRRVHRLRIVRGGRVVAVAGVDQAADLLGRDVRDHDSRTDRGGDPVDPGVDVVGRRLPSDQPQQRLRVDLLQRLLVGGDQPAQRAQRVRRGVALLE